MIKRRPPEDIRKPSEIDILVGENLRRIRQDRDRTLSAVATALGISHQQLQKYETGVNRITAGALFEISHFYSVPVEALYQNPDLASAGDSDPATRAKKKCHVLIDRVDSLDTLTTMERLLRALPTD